ncbi:MAG: plasmid pRiA4b ORF-3 family protein [Actinobacteria bacterium]|nr:plasmid pRiA4b ORF-3 family protein [Actinomycetota bacterium]
MDLHHANQDACGWQNAHLFTFRDASGDVVAGLPDDFGFGDPTPMPRRLPAGTYLKRHWKVAYEYDFGDGWEHTVELKKVVTLDEKFTRRLLDGARAFPPEDCGGLPGYEDVLAVARCAPAPRTRPAMSHAKGRVDPAGRLAALSLGRRRRSYG